jgi:CheY-like chemotaxis protein
MTVQQKNGERARIRFEIADTGPGIRQEDQDQIFAPFVQLEDRPAAQPGTGLGLTICKQYVELMGGQIGVSGEPGVGSVFYFEIPITVLSSESRGFTTEPSRVIGVADGQPRYRLLIAEDEPENRLLLHRLLEPLGFDLREAVNGQEAVTIFTEWHPHLIWMDIRMPVMDGLEATRRIKAADVDAQTRIVALTAHALENEQHEILAAGCDALIRKPYKESEIIDALIKQLGVHFDYDDGMIIPAVATDSLNVDLDDLPEKLRDKLEQALIRIDIGLVNKIIDEIRLHHPTLADVMAIMARDLRFGQMLLMIRNHSAKVRKGPEVYEGE